MTETFDFDKYDQGITEITDKLTALARNCHVKSHELVSKTGDPSEIKILARAVQCLCLCKDERVTFFVGNLRFVAEFRPNPGWGHEWDTVILNGKHCGNRYGAVTRLIEVLESSPSATETV